MPLPIEVNGVARVRLGLQGPNGGGALEELGISENGIRLSIANRQTNVMSDAAGQVIPHDFIDQGAEAFMTITFTLFDRTVLERWAGRRHGVGGNSMSSQQQRGVPIFQTGLGFRLVIDSPLLNLPYRFFFTTFEGNLEQFLGTNPVNPTLPFHAIPREVDGRWALYDRQAG